MPAGSDDPRPDDPGIGPVILGPAQREEPLFAEARADEIVAQTRWRW